MKKRNSINENPEKDYLKIAAKVFFALYSVSLFCSIAAMEATTAVLALISIGFIYRAYSLKSFKVLAASLRLGPDFWLWSYVVVALVGALWVAESGSHFHQMAKDLRWVVLFYLIAYGMRELFNSKYERIFINMISVMLIVVGVYALIQLLFGLEFFRSRKVLVEWGGYYRAVGFFNMPLTFAYVIGMPTLVALSYVVLGIGRTSWKNLWIPFVATLFGGVAVVVSLTRGAWLAMLVSAIMALIMVARKRVIAGGVLVMGLVFLILMQNPLVAVRVSSLGRFQSQTYMDRWALAQANWEMFKDHPLLGVGLHQNYRYVEKYYDKLGIDYTIMKGHAHNNIMQFLGGVGSLGVMAYIGFCFWFLWLSVRLYRHFGQDQLFYKSLALGIFLAQVFFHVGGLSECNFMDAEVKHMLIFWWSILVLIWYESGQLMTAKERL